MAGGGDEGAGVLPGSVISFTVSGEGVLETIQSPPGTDGEMEGVSWARDMAKVKQPGLEFGLLTPPPGLFLYLETGPREVAKHYLAPTT